MRITRLSIALPESCMRLGAEIVSEVRSRAKYGCEYCGVSEIDAGGELSIDHFQPVSRDGSDELDNLVYCCVRCNQYKHAYWPESAGAAPIWNPRHEPAETHFVELEDGQLLALTEVGEFTLNRLRLNRGPLVSYRLMKRRQDRQRGLLNQYQALAQSLEQLHAQLDRLVHEQQSLLAEQNELLRRFLMGGEQ